MERRAAATSTTVSWVMAIVRSHERERERNETLVTVNAP